MKCEKCLYRKNCQFISKHHKFISEYKKAVIEKSVIVTECTAFENEEEFKAKIKDEAIKEFAERLIDKAEHIATWSDGELAITISEIEDTAKELVGKNNDSRRI